MNDFLSTYQAALVLLVVAMLAHEPLRWMGLYFGRRVAADSEIFVWVRAVATALVAALVMRLLLFPAGELAHIDLGIRIGSVLGGIALFFAARRNLAAGVSGAAVLLVLADFLMK